MSDVDAALVAGTDLGADVGGVVLLSLLSSSSLEEEEESEPRSCAKGFAAIAFVRTGGAEHHRGGAAG